MENLLPAMIVILIRLQYRQLRIGQLKIENLGVLQDTGRRYGFGKWVEALSSRMQILAMKPIFISVGYTHLLQTPPQEDLSLCLASAFDNILQRRIIPTICLRQWSPCLDQNASFLTPFDDISALKPGMKLDLVDTQDSAFTLAEL